MIYTCSWNSSYSAAAYCFDSCSHKKLTIFSSSSPSSNSSNYSLDSSTSRNILRSVVEKRTHVSIVVGSVSVKKKHFWNKLRFGSKKFRSIILLHLICFVYASNIAVIKEVEGFTDPAYFSAVRFAVSTVPFLPFVFKARKDAEVRSYGLELGLWVSLGYLSEALGLVTSDAGRASFISLFTVIVIPLLESMLGEMVPARTWFGILMSVVGISMLECSGSPPNIGDLFNFVSAIFFGIHTLRTEQISRTTRKENIFALLGYEVGVVAIMSTLWCLIGSSDDGLSLSWDWMFEFPWIPALYTGVFSTGLCLWGEVPDLWGFQFISSCSVVGSKACVGTIYFDLIHGLGIAALRDVSATETAVIYGLEPLWGAGFAWFLLGERWGVAGWIGAALILGGSLTVQILGSDGHVSKEKNKMKETMSASPVMVRSSSPDNAIHVYKKK